MFPINELGWMTIPYEEKRKRRPAWPSSLANCMPSKPAAKVMKLKVTVEPCVFSQYLHAYLFV